MKKRDFYKKRNDIKVTSKWNYNLRKDFPRDPILKEYRLCVIDLKILPMKEYERLFAQNNENGVPQFWHFGHDKHKGPVSSHTILFNKTEIEQRHKC